MIIVYIVKKCFLQSSITLKKGKLVQMQDIDWHNYISTLQVLGGKWKSILIFLTILFFPRSSSPSSWNILLNVILQFIQIGEWFADFFYTISYVWFLYHFTFMRMTFCLPSYFFVPVLSFLSNKFDCSLKLFKIGPRPIRCLKPMHIQSIGLY